MLKALHDRKAMKGQNAAARGGGKGDGSSSELDEEDQKAILAGAHFCKFASAAYGISGNISRRTDVVVKERSLPVRGIQEDSMYFEKRFVAEDAGVEVDDVKDLDNGSVEMRAYLLVLDHPTKSVVLGIRGTYSLADAMVDLVLDPTDFAGGKAHRGIARSALVMWIKVKDKVEALLKENPDYKLVLTGHSLGAGTAILATMLFREESTVVEALEAEEGLPEERPEARLDAGRPVDIECYAFASPPIYRGPGDTEMPGVFSFVNGCDCIPRVSLGSVYSLFRTLRQVDKIPLDTGERMRFIVKTLLLQREGGDVDEESIRRSVASPVEDAAETKDEPSEAEEAISRAALEEQAETGNAEPEATSGGPWAAFLRLDAEFKKFTEGINVTADRVLKAVGEAVEVYQSLNSDDPAFVQRVATRLAAVEGPTSEEVEAMLQECQDTGFVSERHAFGDDVTVGDLIVPGKLYWLRRDPAVTTSSSAEDNPEEEKNEKDEAEKRGCTVERVTPEQVEGLWLNHSMASDHSLVEYEPAMAAAKERRYGEKVVGCRYGDLSFIKLPAEEATDTYDLIDQLLRVLRPADGEPGFVFFDLDETLVTRDTCLVDGFGTTRAVMSRLEKKLGASSKTLERIHNEMERDYYAAPARLVDPLLARVIRALKLQGHGVYGLTSNGLDGVHAPEILETLSKYRIRFSVPEVRGELPRTGALVMDHPVCRGVIFIDNQQTRRHDKGEVMAEFLGLVLQNNGGVSRYPVFSWANNGDASPFLSESSGGGGRGDVPSERSRNPSGVVKRKCVLVDNTDRKCEKAARSFLRDPCFDSVEFHAVHFTEAENLVGSWDAVVQLRKILRRLKDSGVLPDELTIEDLGLPGGGSTEEGM